MYVDFAYNIVRHELTIIKDCQAYKLQGSEGGWQLAGTVESKGRPGAARADDSALNMFKQMDLKGKTKDDTKLDTIHQNTISTIRVYESGANSVTKFSSKFFFGRFIIK
jgi:actin related protein 2/3 complex subunit 1A/1B